MKYRLIYGFDQFYDSSGQAVYFENAGDTLEITGYFSDINISLYSGGSYDAYTMHLIEGNAEYPEWNWLQRSPEMPLRGF